MASLTSSPQAGSQDRVVKALDTTIGVIKFAKEAVPIELAQGVLSSVAGILSIVRDSIKNKEDFMSIIHQGEEISAAIVQATTGRRADDPVFVTAADDLKSAVEKVHAAIKEKSDRQVIAKVFTASIDKGQISVWKEDIASALRLFTLKLGILNAAKLDEISRMLKEMSESLSAQPHQLREKIAHQPPATPTYFFGRSKIVRETVIKLLHSRHVALAGPGGIGKTSIAKAVINDGDVIERFGGERYFISFDNHVAGGQGNSTVTFDTFSDQIANALGLRPTNADKQKIILAHVVGLSCPVLLVLDNAETILHASIDTGRIATMIEELGSRPPVVLMFTTRSQSLPNNLQYETLSVPPLAVQDALEAFKAIYKSSIDDVTVKNLLVELECHPLSINLLAHAAERNNWSQEYLVERWQKERTQVLALNASAGKSQSLAVSLNLSLNSPSCQAINPKVNDVLRIIAFLPEGSDVQNLEKMVPSVSNPQSMVDSLCQLSLTYRKGQFITMLAPIRMHLLSNENASLSQLPLLTEVRHFYNDQILRSAPEEGPPGRKDAKHRLERIDGKWICTEDINVERLLAYDMEHAKNTRQKVEVIRLCIAFMNLLLQYKPRTTILEEHIKAIAVQRPQRLFRVSLPTATNALMVRRAWGLFFVGELAGHAVGEFGKALSMYKDSFKGFEALGAKDGMTAALVTQGELYQVLGDFLNSEKVFNLARKTARRPVEQGRLNVSLAMLSAFMGRPDAARFAEAGRKHLDSLPQTGDSDSIRARVHPRLALGYIAYFNNDQPSARRSFQEALDICEHSLDKSQQYGDDPRGEVLLCLSGVAIREGNFDDALKLLERCRMIQPDGPLGFRGVTNSLILQTSLAVDEGNFDLARSQVNQAIAVAVSAGEGNIEQAVAIYIHGRIELLAGDLVKARSDFDRAIVLFDALSDVRFKSRSYRALGEIAMLEKNTNEAEKFFGKAKSLCDTMGIQPKFLYVCFDCFTLPERFAGWQTFLNGQSHTIQQ